MKTETLEEYLARGGKISYPKPTYPIVLPKVMKVATGRKKPTPPCGTNAKYSKGCRCDLCKEAKRVYQRFYNREVNKVKPENFRGKYKGEE
jgi:hypothetical protein